MSASLINHPALAMDDTGVAPVVTSFTVEPTREEKMTILPTPAGLKMLCPKPPNTSLPKKMAKNDATPMEKKVVVTGTIKASIIAVTKGNELLRCTLIFLLVAKAKSTSVTIATTMEVTKIPTP